MLVIVLPFQQVSHAALDQESKAFRALENVERVELSLKFVQQDIEKGGDPSTITNEIKALLNNYRLRDNIELSAQLVSEGNREKAIRLGKDAFEDLSQILEYFPESFDDITGSKIAPREILTFAQEGSKVAASKLHEMVELFPSDAIAALKSGVATEFESSSKE